MNSSAIRIGTPRRLEDEGIAAGDRRCAFPERDHGREVERRDAGNDAERLAHGIEVDARPRAVGEFALHQVRNAAGEFDHLESALDVALGVADRLAVLAREQLGERVIFLGDQFQELEHHPRAALRVHGGPGRLRGFGVLDGRAHFGLRRERDPGDHLAGHGLIDVACAPRRALDVLPADEMADLAHGAPPPWIFPGASRRASFICT
jgi:hypothetical protein